MFSADDRLTTPQLDDVAKARPEITKTVENMVSKGKWTVPGYTESESAIAPYTRACQSLCSPAFLTSSQSLA